MLGLSVLSLSPDVFRLRWNAILLKLAVNKVEQEGYSNRKWNDYRLCSSLQLMFVYTCTTMSRSPHWKQLGRLSNHH